MSTRMPNARVAWSAVEVRAADGAQPPKANVMYYSCTAPCQPRVIKSVVLPTGTPTDQSHSPRLSSPPVLSSAATAAAAVQHAASIITARLASSASSTRMSHCYTYIEYSG